MSNSCRKSLISDWTCWSLYMSYSWICLWAKVVPLSEYMSAGLPLREMNRLKAAIKTSDVRSLTKSRRIAFVAKHKKRNVRLVIPRVSMPHVTRAARHSYTATRESLETLTRLIGNESLKGLLIRFSLKTGYIFLYYSTYGRSQW